MKVGSLGSPNFRLMEGSFLIFNTGYFMQFTATNWLVLSLTGSPVDAGVTSGLMFLPMVVLGMAGGVLADRFPKRWIVLFTYIGWAALTGILAGLTLSHVVQLWQVQLIAAGLGVLNALGWPAQQAFVTELVGPDLLHNAVSIHSSLTQVALLVGPASGGLLISAVGPGGSFLIAAASCMVPLVAVTQIRVHELRAPTPVPLQRGLLREGLRYAVGRPDVLWPTILAGTFGVFTGNISVTLAVYARSVYDSGPGGYGFLSATVAVGSLLGALLALRLRRGRVRTLVLLAMLLSGLYTLSAFAPSQYVFAALLAGIGAGTLLLQTMGNSMVLLAAHGSMRGRIGAIYLLVWSAGIAVGGPLVGAIDEHLGPQAGMLIAGAVPGVVTFLIAARLGARARPLRRHGSGGDGTPPPPETSTLIRKHPNPAVHGVVVVLAKKRVT